MVRNSRLIGAVLAFFVAATAQAQSQGCNTQTLKGTYGILLNATIPNVGSAVAVAILTFDGHGGWSSSDTSSLNGNVTNTTVTGTYAVAQECTATLTYKFGEFSSTVHLVIVDNGKEFYGIEGGPGPATLIGKRQ